jgi:hypothetical protein
MSEKAANTETGENAEGGEAEPHSGGDPEGLARCTQCRKIYPIQRSGEGDLRPIGTGGACDCGNATFEPVESDPSTVEWPGPDVP